MNSPHYLSAAAPTTSAASHLLTCRGRSSPGQRRPRAPPRRDEEDLPTQAQLLNPLHAHLCRRGLRSLCFVSFAFLHAGWTQTGTSCRKVQTCWDAWRGDLSSPFFFQPKFSSPVVPPCPRLQKLPTQPCEDDWGGALTGIFLESHWKLNAHLDASGAEL